MEISRSEAGEEVMPTSAFGVKSTNYVVPHYTTEGLKTRQGMAAGGIVVNNDAKMRMERIMMKHGERIPGFFERKPEPTPVVVAPKPTKSRSKRTTSKVKAATYVPKVEDNLPLPDFAQAGATPQQIQDIQSLQAPASKGNVVVFHTPFGTINVVTDAILETELGLALVFRDDSEIRFTPNRGNDLTLTLPGGKDINVMYLGIVFKWYNTNQKVMTFIKHEEKE